MSTRIDLISMCCSILETLSALRYHMSKLFTVVADFSTFACITEMPKFFAPETLDFGDVSLIFGNKSCDIGVCRSGGLLEIQQYL